MLILAAPYAQYLEVRYCDQDFEDCFFELGCYTESSALSRKHRII